jgi:serine/threonine-protein kinase RsbT
MQPGYSTAPEEAREMGFGAGMGLPNMARNADDILIESEPGRRTRACMTFFLDTPKKLQ